MSLILKDQLATTVPSPDTGKTAIFSDATDLYIKAPSGTVTKITNSSAGTVTSFSFTDGAGISGTVLNSTTTPTLSLTLGAITPTSVAATGTVTGSNLSGTNSGDQTITLTGDVTGSGTGSFAVTLATVPISKGGTGQTTANSALNALLPSQTADLVLGSDGTNTSWVQRAHVGANSDITSLSGITGGISTVDYIDFDTVNAQTPAVGRLTWDMADRTLQVGLSNNVNLQIGQEEVQRVTNVTGGTLLNGRAVRVVGAVGNRISVDYAEANSDANSTTILGVLTETLNNNGQGFATISGVIHDVDTSAFTEGDVLYLSPTMPGVITNVKPTAPQHLVQIGYCVRSHATVGQIFINVQNGYELGELHDVKITSVASGDILTYSTSVGAWINNSKSATLTALLPTQTGNTGKFLQTDGSVTSWVAGNSGTVTSVSIVTENGVSGTVANASSTPAITLSLGDITPTSVAASGLISGSNFSGSSSGINSGDQTITLTGDVTGSGTGSFAVTLATVPVAKGGTGATTLTGYVKGTGTSALTGVSTIPGSDISGIVGPKIGNVTASTSTATVDFTDVDIIRLTLQSSVSTLTITGAVDGQRVILQITQDATGSRTITWPANVRYGTDITAIPPLSTAAGKTDQIGFIYNAPSTTYDVVAISRGY